MEGNKWRGGFMTDFPPRSAPAEPLDGATPWLHHTMAFEDRFHDTVAVHIPESIRHGSPAYRPNRMRTKEITGADMSHQFWPQHTHDLVTPSGDKRLDDRADLLPNPSRTCTWNTNAPPSPLPSRVYPKSLHHSPRGIGLEGSQIMTGHAGGDPLLSASQLDASGINTASGSG